MTNENKPQELAVIKVRPGIMLRLTVTVNGGVAYTTEEITAPHVDGSGALVSTWETTKIVEDPEEHARARKVVARARNHVAAGCIVSNAFGLICPLPRKAELARRIGEARGWIEAFNAGASTCHVTLRALPGQVMADDTETVREIAAEVAAMISNMERGIATADPDKIRDAAKEARALGKMLDPVQGERVNAAIEEARKAARTIAARVGKAGESAAKVVGEIKIDSLVSARRTFLDLSAAGEVGQVPAAIASQIDAAPAEVELAAPARAALVEEEASAVGSPAPARVATLDGPAMAAAGEGV